MQGDPIQLLLKLEELYQEYGAVKLVTPSQWNPPFCFKSNNNGITSRVQHLYKLKFGKVHFFLTYAIGMFVFLILFLNVGIQIKIRSIQFQKLPRVRKGL